MAASLFQYKVQRATARSVLLCSTRRLPLGRYRMGDSQAHAVPFASCELWWIRCGARLAFLAHVGLHPIRRTPCDSGFRRRVGYVPRHDHRLVGESKAVGGHGELGEREHISMPSITVVLPSSLDAVLRQTAAS